MKIDTKAKYDARFKKRSEKAKQQPKNGPRRDYTNLAGHHAHGYGMKPRHEERYASIYDCFPLLQIGHTAKSRHVYGHTH